MSGQEIEDKHCGWDIYRRVLYRLGQSDCPHKYRNLPDERQRRWKSQRGKM